MCVLESKSVTCTNKNHVCMEIFIIIIIIIIFFGKLYEKC